MNICKVDEGEFTEIKKSVKSIFFFATPHRGSATADLAASIAMFSNIASCGIKPFRPAFLKTLRLDSKELYDISMDFRKQTLDFKFYTFLEMLKTAGPNTIVRAYLHFVLNLSG